MSEGFRNALEELLDQPYGQARQQQGMDQHHLSVADDLQVSQEGQVLQSCCQIFLILQQTYGQAHIEFAIVELLRLVRLIY
jgi:hypothetical protein